MLIQESNDLRYISLIEWLKKLYPNFEIDLSPIVGDASFRRYYRFSCKDQNFVIMDSPPDKEDCQSFIEVSKLFARKGLHVPHIYHENTDDGFLVLSDLGDELYSRQLTSQNADSLYKLAIDQLQIIQSLTLQDFCFPLFSPQLLREELLRFQEWFLEKYLKVDLSDLEKNILNEAFGLLIQNALEQPQTCVHRDYHSRNLLKFKESVGILDFQDAVWGPFTYDLVSLIRDCYIDWPKEKTLEWASYFYEGAQTLQITREQFLRWFDLMGVQRHLKAIYIFARKFVRDGTPLYLPHIPRAMNYIFEVTQHYPELCSLRKLLMRYVCYEGYDSGCR